MMVADGFGSNGASPAQARRLGQVVGGSLSRGLDVRLDGYGASAEDVAVGSFVTIQGRRQRYFAVVTDVELRAVDDGVRHFPPAFSTGNANAGDFTTEVIAGTLAYGQLSVMPSMAVPIGDSSSRSAEQAKTIPEHFAPVFAASQADIDAVFRARDGDFALGSPQGMESSLVRLDLAALANRSVGVFGASGTGKTFLARMLLAGLVKQTPAVSLVFDMESEYGWQGQDNDRGRQVKGLKQLFPSPGRNLHPGRSQQPPPRGHARRDREHRLQRGRAGGHRGAAGVAQPVGSGRLHVVERRPALPGKLAPRIHGPERRRGRRSGSRNRRQSVGPANAASPPAVLGAVRVPGGKWTGQRQRRRHHRAVGARQPRGAGVWAVRAQHRRLRPGQQPADPPHPRNLGATQGVGRRRPRRRTPAAGDLR